MADDVDPPLGSQPIGAVARQLEVTEATLRAWERRYEAVVPTRTSGGQRRYSPAQVQLLRAVIDRIHDGQRPAEAFADVHRLSASPEAPSGSPPVALVVERTAVAGAAVAAMLTARGLDVVVGPDPATALDDALRIRPDVSVVELLVGGGTGLELCRRLRAELGRPVVAISALRPTEDALEGVDAFLAKPLDPELLWQAVQSVVERRAAS